MSTTFKAKYFFYNGFIETMYQIEVIRRTDKIDKQLQVCNNTRNSMVHTQMPQKNKNQNIDTSSANTETQISTLTWQYKLKLHKLIHFFSTIF